MFAKLLQNLRKRLLGKRFNTLTLHGIFRIETLTESDGTVRKAVYHKGRELDAEVVAQIRSEAAILSRSRIYPLILEAIEYEAYRDGIRTSTSDTELIFAKALLESANIHEQTIATLSEM